MFSVLVTLGQGSSCGYPKSRLRGRSVYALELRSARFNLAPLLISSLGDKFHCASTLLTAQKRKAQTHSLTADSPKEQRETFLFVLVLLPGLSKKPAGLGEHFTAQEKAPSCPALPCCALPCPGRFLENSWKPTSL